MARFLAAPIIMGTNAGGDLLGSGSGAVFRQRRAFRSRDGSLTYYGLVCGTLAWLGARLRDSRLRFAVGIAVELVAAGL